MLKYVCIYQVDSTYSSIIDTIHFYQVHIKAKKNCNFHIVNNRVEWALDQNAVRGIRQKCAKS